MCREVTLPQHRKDRQTQGGSALRNPPRILLWDLPEPGCCCCWAPPPLCPLVCHKACWQGCWRSQQNAKSSLACDDLWVCGCRGACGDPARGAGGLLQDEEAALASLNCLFLSRGLLVVSICPVCHTRGHEQKLPREAAPIWTSHGGRPAPVPSTAPHGADGGSAGRTARLPVPLGLGTTGTETG